MTNKQGRDSALHILRKESASVRARELLLPFGSIAAEGYGKYIKLPLDKIADFNFDEQEGRVTIAENDPTTVEVQQKTSTGIP